MPIIPKYIIDIKHTQDNNWMYNFYCHYDGNNKNIQIINNMLEKYTIINNTITGNNDYYNMNTFSVYFLYFYIKYNYLSTEIKSYLTYSNSKYESLKITIDGDDIGSYINSIVMLDNILKNNIYDYIDKLISKNSNMIKDKYINMILNNDLKNKYNHLIQASNFDLI